MRYKREIKDLNKRISLLTMEVGRLQIDLDTAKDQIAGLQASQQVTPSRHRPIPSTTTSQSLDQEPADPASVVENEFDPSPRKRARRALDLGSEKDIENRVVLGELYLDVIKEMSRAQVPRESLTRRNLSSFVARETGLNRSRFSKRRTDRVPNKRLDRATRNRNLVQAFLMRQDNATTKPGKKDAVRVGKEKRQIYVLNDYLMNLHKKYNEEHPNNKVQLTTFKNWRPKNIRLVSEKRIEDCYCGKCRNWELLTKPVSTAIGASRVPDQAPKFVKEIDDDTFEQMVTDFKTKHSGRKEPIIYQTWERTKDENEVERTTLVTKQIGLTGFIKMLKEGYANVKEHIARHNNQVEQVRFLRDNLPDDGSACTMQMDFAENYTARASVNTQSSYWNQKSITLHPIVVHWKENGEKKDKSYAVVVDSRAHGPATVSAIIDRMAVKLKNDMPNLKYITYVTDSPTSQYRNRQMMEVLIRHEELYGTRAGWLYSEVGHGKGPCDGVGGAVKRRAEEALKRGVVDFSDPLHFYRWGCSLEKEKQTSVNFVFVSQPAVTLFEEHVRACEFPKITEIMKAHAAMVQDSKLYLRDRSCYGPCCFDKAENKFLGKCPGWLQKYPPAPKEPKKKKPKPRRQLGRRRRKIPTRPRL